MNLDDAKQVTIDLLELNREQRIIREAADKMYNLQWDLPDNLKGLQWIQKRVVKFPYDSVEAGKRAFATMEPNFNLTRPSMNPETMERYNNIENTLRWQFMKASKRRYPIVATALEHAMLYGEVVMQPIHVDAQMQLMGNVPLNKQKAIKKYGDFVIPVHNPQGAMVRYTDYGIDAVVLIRVQTVAEFMSFWGEKGKKIRKDFDSQKGKGDNNFVVSYDYTDFENRAVWAKLQETRNFVFAADTQTADGTEILNVEHGLPFMPWAAASTPNKQGLLYPLHQSDAWKLANLSETFMFSEGIAYAAAPRMKKTGPGDVVVDYGEPGRMVDLPPGTDVAELEPPALDQNLAALTDRTRQDAQLVPEIVLSGDAPAGSAFASINQLMQSGLQTFAPYREITERALEEVGCLMLEWAKYIEKPIKAPIRKRSAEQVFAGGEFVLNPDEYDPRDIEIIVELKPDMPVDRQAQITAASSAVQFLGWDRARANAMLGYNDPQQIEKDKALEVLRDTKLQGVVMKQQAQDQLEAQAITANLGQIVQYALDPQIGPAITQMLQQFVGQVREQEQSGQSGGVAPVQNPANSPTLGMDTVGGMAFDASQGGTPAATANPEGNTRAYQRGADSRGQQTP